MKISLMQPCPAGTGYTRTKPQGLSFKAHPSNTCFRHGPCHRRPITRGHQLANHQHPGLARPARSGAWMSLPHGWVTAVHLYRTCQSPARPNPPAQLQPMQEPSSGPQATHTCYFFVQACMTNMQRPYLRTGPSFTHLPQGPQIQYL